MYCNVWYVLLLIFMVSSSIYKWDTVRAHMRGWRFKPFRFHPTSLGNCCWGQWLESSTRLLYRCITDDWWFRLPERWWGILGMIIPGRWNPPNHIQWSPQPDESEPSLPQKCGDAVKFHTFPQTFPYVSSLASGAPVSFGRPLWVVPATPIRREHGDLSHDCIDCFCTGWLSKLCMKVVQV